MLFECTTCASTWPPFIYILNNVYTPHNLKLDGNKNHGTFLPHMSEIGVHKLASNQLHILPHDWHILNYDLRFLTDYPSVYMERFCKCEICYCHRILAYHSKKLLSIKCKLYNRSQMSEQSFVSVCHVRFLSTDNSLMWICEVWCVVWKRWLTIGCFGMLIMKGGIKYPLLTYYL
jgi:hypothetical protein